MTIITDFDAEKEQSFQGKIALKENTIEFENQVINVRNIGILRLYEWKKKTSLFKALYSKIFNKPPNPKLFGISITLDTREESKFLSKDKQGIEKLRELIIKAINHELVNRSILFSGDEIIIYQI